MMDYIVIENYKVADFEEEVNDAILHGYRPIGGMSIAVHIGTVGDGSGDTKELHTYVQAMVKE